MTYSYYDNYGIPYGKYNLTTNTAIKNPNFVDALANNMQIVIGNSTVPFTITSLSNNQFAVTASVSQSYYG